MVTDKNNKIYTELMEFLKSEYPKIDGGTKSEAPPTLPYVYFFQLDGRTRLTTLSNTEDGVTLAFQIEIYSDKGMNDARKIANSVRGYMIADGFRCRRFSPDQNSSNVSRFVTRFQRLDV